MSTYISGPMRGIKHFNFPMFRECEEYLMEVGLGVEPIFNPARHDAEVLGMGWQPDETQEVTEAQLHSWMRKDLTEVAASNLMVLLPGWGGSQGSRREVQVARWCGVHITEYEPESAYGYRLKPLSADDVDWVLSEPLDVRATVTEMKRSVPGLDPEVWGRDVIERTATAQQAFDAMVKAAEARITEDYAKDIFGSIWHGPKPKSLRTNEQNEILGIFANMLALPTGDGGNKRARGEKPSWKKDGSHLRAAYRHLDPSRDRYDEDSGTHKYVHAAWRLLAVAYQEMVQDGLIPGDPE